MPSELVNTRTGEIIKADTPDIVHKMYVAADLEEKAGKETKKLLKPVVLGFMGSKKEAYGFKVSEATTYGYDPEVLISAIEDKDQAVMILLQCLRPNALDIERLKELVDTDEVDKEVYQEVVKSKWPISTSVRLGLK